MGENKRSLSDSDNVLSKFTRLNDKEIEKWNKRLKVYQYKLLEGADEVIKQMRKRAALTIILSKLWPMGRKGR